MALFNESECEHCGKTYLYSLLHSGFGDHAYAYCDVCGMLATLYAWNPQMKNLPAPVGWHGEIDSGIEPFLHPCACGGRFRKGASPKCPHCNCALSAEFAAVYFERNAPGTAKGWRWQRSWNGIYCIGIEDPASPGVLRVSKDPLRADL